MKRIAGFATVVLMTITSGAVAQDRPNFSGRWTMEEPAAAPNQPARGGGGGGGGGGRGGARAGSMGSGWGTPITITQDANKLTVEYMFFGRGDMQPPLRFIYALDGSETKNTLMMGRGMQEQTARTRWDNDKLVITTLYTFPDPADGKKLTAEVIRTLSLESPTSLAVETVWAGVLGGPASTTRTLYTKTQTD